MDRFTVAEAAQRLCISQDAVYKRIKRGTIPWDKAEDGKTVVYLQETIEESSGSTDEAQSSTDDPTERLKISTDGSSSESTDWSTDVLVDELRDRVRFLEEELRRKDAILLTMAQRIPELEAAPEAIGASQTASEHQDNGTAQDDEEDRQKPSWWRRFFGFE
jgi:hypothetical protein